MLNAISVDVEEYFHATNMDPYIGRARWDSMKSRAEASMNNTLSVFESTDTRGTFFVLGHFAKKHPELVRQIADAGHEVASHGFNHQLAYLLSPEEFYNDISSTKKLLEDISGQAVSGYRAPNFSITEQNPWAYAQLVRAGYTYDSSLYPVWHPRYANVKKPRSILDMETDAGPIKIVPLAASELRVFNKVIRLPVAGGAYWRLFPEWFNRWGLARINNKDKLPFCCYIHPWELDPEQPRIEEMPFLTKIRHYGGLSSFQEKVTRYLEAFSFTSIAAVINAVNEASDS